MRLARAARRAWPQDAAPFRHLSAHGVFLGSRKDAASCRKHLLFFYLNVMYIKARESMDEGKQSGMVTRAENAGREPAASYRFNFRMLSLQPTMVAGQRLKTREERLTLCIGMTPHLWEQRLLFIGIVSRASRAKVEQRSLQ